MRQSIFAVASFWYTAWVNAGQPDLESITGIALPDSILEQQKKEEARWKKGKLKTKGHED